MLAYTLRNIFIAVPQAGGSVTFRTVYHTGGNAADLNQPPY